MTLLIDLLLVACLLLTMIAGARSGFFRELFALLGLVGGVYLAMRFVPVLLAHLPPFFRTSTFAAIVAFLLLFFLAFGLLRLLGSAFAALWEGKQISGLSRLFGLILGTVRGAVMILFLVGALVLLFPSGSRVLAHSRVLPFLSSGIQRAAGLLPEEVRMKFQERWKSLRSSDPVRGDQVEVWLGGSGLAWSGGVRKEPDRTSAQIS